MSATEDLRHLIEQRDMLAADIAKLDRRIAETLGPFGKEKGYIFKPSLDSARKDLGL